MRVKLKSEAYSVECSRELQDYVFTVLMFDRYDNKMFITAKNERTLNRLVKKAIKKGCRL